MKNTDDKIAKSNPITTVTENTNKTQKTGDVSIMTSMPENTAPIGNKGHM